MNLDDSIVEVYIGMADLLSDDSEMIKRINLLEIACDIRARDKRIFVKLLDSYFAYFERMKFKNLNGQILVNFQDKTLSLSQYKLSTSTLSQITDFKKKLKIHN